VLIDLDKIETAYLQLRPLSVHVFAFESVLRLDGWVLYLEGRWPSSLAWMGNESQGAKCLGHRIAKGYHPD